jgi:type II protein arginine methyltransferase
MVQAIRASGEIVNRDLLVNRRGKPQRDFPVWHFAMVNDGPRNSAIETSIASLDLTGKTVVEIGSGTGLIALLFAKHGAARVITCEMNANLADVARRIIDQTPYADRIKVINQSSTVAIERGLLPREPDVIFTETLDCGVVGEGFHAIVRDVRRLAGPNTIVMPRRVFQTAALIESESMADLNRAETVCGFDLRLLNEFSTGNYFPAHSELHLHRFLSESTLFREYCYREWIEPAPVQLVARTNGTVHGVLSWFSADFGASAVSNAPGSGSHWHQAFHPLHDPIDVAAGERLTALLDDEGYAWVARCG